MKFLKIWSHDWKFEYYKMTYHEKYAKWDGRSLKKFYSKNSDMKERIVVKKKERKNLLIFVYH